MDLLQHARDLYGAGRMHDALEAAQAACDRAPKDASAWWLLALVSRYTGMPAASDEAFRRAVELDHGLVMPFRVGGERFRALVQEALADLPTGDRPPEAAVRVQPMPTADQVRAGVDPDALTLREPAPHDALVVFQVNHENRAGTEDALRRLLRRSLSH